MASSLRRLLLIHLYVLNLIGERCLPFHLGTRTRNYKQDIGHYQDCGSFIHKITCSEEVKMTKGGQLTATSTGNVTISSTLHGPVLSSHLLGFDEPSQARRRQEETKQTTHHRSSQNLFLIISINWTDFYKLSRSSRAPISTTQTMTAQLPFYPISTQSTLNQGVSVSMSNNAARLYADCEYADAIMLYHHSILLLNKMMLRSPSKEDTMQNAAVRNLSEIRIFTQTIEIPLDSAYDREVTPCSKKIVSAAVMHNIFLLLRKTG
jgi:hypothetical protein